jgi:hypothetical protein
VRSDAPLFVELLLHVLEGLLATCAFARRYGGLQPALHSHRPAVRVLHDAADLVEELQSCAGLLLDDLVRDARVQLDLEILERGLEPLEVIDLHYADMGTENPARARRHQKVGRTRVTATFAFGEKSSMNCEKSG